MNFANVLFEDGKRGEFSLLTLADPAMEHPRDCVVEKNVHVDRLEYLDRAELERDFGGSRRPPCGAGGQQRSSAVRLPHRLRQAEEPAPAPAPAWGSRHDSSGGPVFRGSTEEDERRVEKRGDLAIVLNARTAAQRGACEAAELLGKFRLGARIEFDENCQDELEQLRRHQVLTKFWLWFGRARYKGTVFLVSAKRTRPGGRPRG